MSLVTGLLSAAVPGVRRLSERDRAEREVLQLSPPREHGAFHSALAQTLSDFRFTFGFFFLIYRCHTTGGKPRVCTHTREKAVQVFPRKETVGKAGSWPDADGSTGVEEAL